jgi:hypothetical protein
VSVSGVVVNAGGRGGRCVLTGLTLPFSVDSLQAGPAQKVRSVPPRAMPAGQLEQWKRHLAKRDVLALSRTTVSQALTRIERLDAAAFKELFGFEPYRSCPTANPANVPRS